MEVVDKQVIKLTGKQFISCFMINLEDDVMDVGVKPPGDSSNPAGKPVLSLSKRIALSSGYKLHSLGEGEAGVRVSNRVVSILRHDVLKIVFTYLRPSPQALSSRCVTPQKACDKLRIFCYLSHLYALSFSNIELHPI